MGDFICDHDGFDVLVEMEQNRMKANIASQYIEARRLLGMTQEEVARVSGIKRPNITRFEKGNYNPTIDLLVKVAESMGKRLEIRLVDKEVEPVNREPEKGVSCGKTMCKTE